MRILFVYYDVNGSDPARYACGIGSLSAFLKKKGHQTDLVYFKSELDYNNLDKKIDLFKPGIVGISATTSAIGAVKESKSFNQFTSFIKSRIGDKLVIVGGSHVSVQPETIERFDDNIDGIVIGFGEEPMLELMNKLENNEDYLNIDNFWFKQNNEIIKNKVGNFTDNWDKYFNFDREIFHNELMRLNKNAYRFGNNILGEKVFEYICCRGCPFFCSFCAAPLTKTWGKGKGWINLPSPEHVINYLNNDIEKYNLTGLAFHDDVFTFNKKWFLKWAELYTNKIGLPYACNLRVGTFDGEVTDALVESNCKIAIVGIESGNEFIRTKVGNRKMSNEKIITSLTSLKNAGINIATNNMIGFPGETFDQFMDTITINALIGPDDTCASVFYPYPGTELYDYCRKEGLIDIDHDGEIVERKMSILKFAEFPHKKLMRISEVFRRLVYYEKIIIKYFGTKSIFSLRYLEPLVTNTILFLRSVYRYFNKVIKNIKPEVTDLQLDPNLHAKDDLKTTGINRQGLY